MNFIVHFTKYLTQFLVTVYYYINNNPFLDSVLGQTTSVILSHHKNHFNIMACREKAGNL